jgi:hypothetical protein
MRFDGRRNRFIERYVDELLVWDGLQTWQASVRIRGHRKMVPRIPLIFQKARYQNHPLTLNDPTNNRRTNVFLKSQVCFLWRKWGLQSNSVSVRVMLCCQATQLHRKTYLNEQGGGGGYRPFSLYDKIWVKTFIKKSCTMLSKSIHVRV